MNKQADKHFKYFLIIGISIVFMMQILVFVLFPPADQLKETYDTKFINYTESKCVNCHSSSTIYDPVKNTINIPVRHHLLVVIGRYVCTDCHPVITLNIIVPHPTI